MAVSFIIPFGGAFQRNFIANEQNIIQTLSFYPSDSDSNDFIPFHALHTGRLVQYQGEKCLIYSLDMYTSPYSKRSYDNFFETMIWGEDWTKLDKSNISLDFRCRTGQLIELTSEGNIIPLAVLAVNKTHLFSINKESPDFSKFFIIIDRKFITEEKYSNLYKAFSKYYLEEYNANKFISVLYTNSIQSMCYKHTPITRLKPVNIVESKNMNRKMTYDVFLTLYKQQHI